MLKLSKIDQRLLPLYAGSLLEGLIFWFAMEKLLLRDIGFSDSAIGYSIALMMVLILLLEIPSGILADRWSRRGTLAIGYACLSLASLGGFLSQDVWQYIILVTVPFGIYEAMVSGVYESIVYDTLLEEDNQTKFYEKYLGRTDVFAGIGLTLGSLLSTPIAAIWDVRATYAATIPIGLLAVLLILRFRQPSVHRQNQETELIKHLKQTFSEVLKQPHLYWLLSSIVVTAVAVSILFEFNQIWWIALGLNALWFGPVNALSHASLGVAGAVGHWFTTNKRIISVGLVVAISSGLLVFKSIQLIIVAQVLTMLGLLILDLVLNKKLQDSLSSSVRAGANSVTSTIANGVTIPVIILFGIISDRSTIFSAAFVLAALALILLLGLVKTTRSQQLQPQAQL